MATNKTITQAEPENDVNVTFRLPKSVDRAVEQAIVDGLYETKQQVFETALRQFFAELDAV